MKAKIRNKMMIQWQTNPKPSVKLKRTERNRILKQLDEFKSNVNAKLLFSIIINSAKVESLQ